MRNGFSLVELSIVLVILGLLTGGLLGGRALIHAAELRSVTSEMQKFQTAINAFSDKYGSLPGDFDEAELMWGGPVADCLMTDSGDTTTCNGDGDGKIDYDNGAAPYGDTPYEGLRAWQHLVNSGLLAGDYTGAASSAGTYAHYQSGSNIPQSKYGSNAGWLIFNFPDYVGWSATAGMHYALGAPVNNDGRWHGAALTPQDQWNIDTKMDDGIPFQGRYTDMADIYTPDCTTTDTPPQYDLSNESIACVLFILDE